MFMQDLLSILLFLFLISPLLLLFYFDYKSDKENAERKAKEDFLRHLKDSISVLENSIEEDEQLNELDERFNELSREVNLLNKHLVGLYKYLEVEPEYLYEKKTTNKLEKIKVKKTKKK
jgi:hypothetical protein